MDTEVIIVIIIIIGTNVHKDLQNNDSTILVQFEKL